MNLRFAVLVGVLGIAAGPIGGEEAPAGAAAKPSPGATPTSSKADVKRLKEDVAWVVAPKEGKDQAATPHERMAQNMAARFAKIGLATVPGNSGWFHDVALDGEAGGRARNVVGWLPGERAGSTAETAGEYVLFSTHYDYVGDADPVAAPGADDLGSGLALLLEAARLLVAGRKEGTRPPLRSVLFAAFDLKEQGLRGARGFVAKPPLPLADCAVMINAEYVGRSMGDLVPGLWLALGTEYSADLEAWTQAQGAPANGQLALLSSYYHVSDGDYVAFREAKVAHLFLTAGVSMDWRRPTDVADRIDWPQLVARTDWCRALVDRVAAEPKRPVFRPESDPRVEEVIQLRDLVNRGVKALEAQGLSSDVMANIQRFQRLLDSIVASGHVSRAQRMLLRNMLVVMSNFRPLVKKDDGADR